jgi:hypothetical protein
MNIQEPYKISSIDYNNIVLKRIKTVKNKKIIFLKYNSDNRINNFVTQISKLKVTEILSASEMECEIFSDDSFAFLEGLDDYIKNIILENKTKWFDDNIEMLQYQRILQDNLSLQIKIINNSDFTTQINFNDEQIENFETLPDVEMTAKIILEIYAIWIKNNKCGILIRPINVDIKQKDNNLYNYKFIDESEYETDNSMSSSNSLSSKSSELFLKDTLNITDINNNSTSSNDLCQDINNLML